jgi:hypothetical protein
MGSPAPKRGSVSDTLGGLALVALLTSCGGPDRMGQLDIDALPRLGAEADMRIGSVDDPEIGFSRIGRVDVGRDGRIYVYEWQDMQIRVYGPDGELSHRIGRRGEGPGELQRPGPFGVVGDTVWTFQSAGNRITLFDRDGALLSTGRVTLPGIPLWNRCYGYVLPWDMRPDGLFTSRLGRVACSRNDPAAEVGATDSIRVPRVLFDASGEVVDTIGWDPRPPPRMARPPAEERDEVTFVEIGGRPFSVPQPPTELPQWIGLHDGRVVVSVPIPTSADAAFTVTRIAPSGDTVYHRVLHYTARPYISAQLDALAEEASGGMLLTGPGPPDPAVARRLRESMDFPDLRPATEGAQIDEDERLWIPRYDPGAAVSRWVLLDATGLLLGELELPAGFRLMWSRSDAVWGVELDELDVPWLVRYRIDGVA